MDDRRFAMLYRRLIRSLIPDPRHRDYLLVRLLQQLRCVDTSNSPSTETEETGVKEWKTTKTDAG